MSEPDATETASVNDTTKRTTKVLLMYMAFQ
jgi:hypothetical protein